MAASAGPVIVKCQKDTHAIENITCESTCWGLKKMTLPHLLVLFWLDHVQRQKGFLILPLIRLHVLSLIYDVLLSTEPWMQWCDVCQIHPVFLLRRVHDIYVWVLTGRFRVMHWFHWYFLPFIFSPTNTDQIFHKLDISVKSTWRYFLLCPLSNCGKQNMLGFHSPAKKIRELKKNNNNDN